MNMIVFSVLKNTKGREDQIYEIIFVILPKVAV